MVNVGRKTLLLTLAASLAISSTPQAMARRAHKHARQSAGDTADADSTANAPAKRRGAHGESTPEPLGQNVNNLTLAARGATVIDAYTGETIYSKNADQVFYPASTTKILTALLVIEEGNLDQEVVVEPVDTQVEPSAVGLRPGDRYTRRQMLYALMLKSANDVAQALARDNAGSMAAFAEKMNKRAKELGATSSHFDNPHGLPDANHYTTPHDLALIARAAMAQPLFRQIVSTQFHPWITSDGTTEQLRNHNHLLFEYPGCTGLKTGYTFKAQQVLVSSALRNNREVISVVMHSDKPGIWEDSKQLLTYGLKHLPGGPEFD